ncbi:MAG TPA: toll/interleukin-1 receptor domain-containing protein, partial [Terricaulis sp.]|nr:toll/interleukin-1 receptor domain-containing protein [Terricaulis sp.]
MTVFVAHAPADSEAAEALEGFLERRGQFVELDDGETALRPITPHDVMVLLVSNNLLFAPMRLRLEQRALDAWADGRLIVIKLDHGIAPVGLRDLPFIDASFEAQREFKWQEAANTVREKLRAPQGATAAEGRAPPARKSGWRGAVVLALLTLPGLAALALGGAIWLANRIGPTPSSFADLIAGLDAFGARAGLPPGVTPGLCAGAIVLMAGVLIFSLAR